MNKGAGDHGDKLPHRTIALTTRADGRFRRVVDGKVVVEGAPAPMIIHAPASKIDKQKVTEKMTQNIYDSSGKSSDGFLVLSEQSGSMSTRTFSLWCRHFVSQLPEGQGLRGAPVVLYIDGHNSRWSYEGLKYLRENNVIAFCLPSHTSIWAQVISLQFHYRSAMSDL